MLSPDRFEETLMKRITVGSIVIFMLSSNKRAIFTG
jgi:hypothetical protein